MSVASEASGDCWSDRMKIGVKLPPLKNDCSGQSKSCHFGDEAEVT